MKKTVNQNVKSCLNFELKEMKYGLNRFTTWIINLD